MRWKFFVLVLAVSLFVSLKGVNAACLNSDDIIMRLYYSNNSHGALWNQTSYTYEICYNNTFGSPYAGATPHACTGTGSIPDNKVLGLYSVNNSHAEIPSLDNYTIDVCYGNLVCRAISADCAPEERVVVRLYQDSNSHISNASTTAYLIRICCNVSGGGGGTTLTDAFWASMNSSIEITEADLNDRVRLMVQGTGLEGATIDFTIFKEIPWWFDSKVAETATTGFTTWRPAEEGTYYFTASISGVGSATSGDLIVSDSEDNTPPVTEILSPGICEIYFTRESIGFTQNSSDIDDNIAFYWDFGDGSFSTLLNPTHAYITGGQKTIILTVTDERGLTATDRTTILVVDVSKTGQEKYVCAYINEPEWGASREGFDIFFNATDTYAINASNCNNVICNNIECIAGLCKNQTFSGMPVLGTIPNWPGFENINFSWVFDDGFTYKESGMSGAWFTKTYSNTGSHWAKLTASINPEGSTETQFSNYAYSTCRIESGEWVWWDENGIPRNPLTEGGACLDTDGLPAPPSCCPPGYACEEQIIGDPLTALCVLSGDYCASIVVCDDYLTQPTCENDLCGRGKLQPGSNPGGNKDVDDICGSTSFTFGNGSCRWDTTKGRCVHAQGLKSTIYQETPFVYTCEDETSHGECIDGLMNIIKKGTLILVSGGSLTPEIIEECGIKLCPDYEGAIMCGSQLVKLIFFSLRNLITAVLVIIIIYIVLVYRKKVKKNKKRENKKTARKKKL